MAPKLPPPANTKAVFAGLAWFNTDKETLAPATRVGGARGVLAEFVAGDRRVYHSLHRRPRERGANAATHNHRCVLLPRVAAAAIAKHKAVAMGPGSRPGRQRISSLRSLVRDDGRSALDERLLDHEMAGLAVIAFGKTARFEHLAQFFQHGRAAAHHDPIALDIERRLADIVEQLL